MGSFSIYLFIGLIYHPPLCYRAGYKTYNIPQLKHHWAVFLKISACGCTHDGPVSKKQMQIISALDEAM